VHPDFAAPRIHPLENLLSVKRTFNVLLSYSLTRGTKNFQLLDARYKVDRFLAALFFPQSTTKPMVKGSRR